jgi:hypothetical protein
MSGFHLAYFNFLSGFCVLLCSDISLIMPYVKLVHLSKPVEQMVLHPKSQYKNLFPFSSILPGKEKVWNTKNLKFENYYLELFIYLLMKWIMEKNVKSLVNHECTGCTVRKKSSKIFLIIYFISTFTYVDAIQCQGSSLGFTNVVLCIFVLII